MPQEAPGMKVAETKKAKARKRSNQKIELRKAMKDN